MTTLQKSALGYIATVIDVQSAVYEYVQIKCWSVYIRIYRVNFKCILVELLWTGLTAYTQQECTYSALLLYQPSYKQMYNSRVLQTVKQLSEVLDQS